MAPGIMAMVVFDQGSRTVVKRPSLRDSGTIPVQCHVALRGTGGIFAHPPGREGGLVNQQQDNTRPKTRMCLASWAGGGPLDAGIPCTIGIPPPDYRNPVHSVVRSPCQWSNQARDGRAAILVMARRFRTEGPDRDSHSPGRRTQECSIPRGLHRDGGPP